MRRVGLPHPLSLCNPPTIRAKYVIHTATLAFYAGCLGQHETVESGMPTYAYRCMQCGRTFEHEERLAEHGSEQPACPDCGGHEVVSVPVPVMVKTSRKS